MTNTTKSKSVSMRFEDGILYGRFSPKITIDLKVATEVVELRKKLTNNKFTPILVDVSDISEVTRDARNFLSSNEGSELLTAAAILVSSKFSSFMANFFLKVNSKKLELPIRVFNSKKEALIWLQQYK